ncbi:MAG TPA: SIMPL domain-containing protein [Thermoanaerobaculia bacterium]|nr:SIMPL domain-containing protein [Thermoanaerobaculia bacterium]
MLANKHASLLAAAGLLVWTAANAGAQSPPEGTVASMLVNGSAQLEVEPDEAIVRLGVSFQAPDAAAAQSRVNTTARAILDAVKAKGIAESAIQTSRLDLSPMYENRRSDDGAPTVVGYQASNVVSVTLAELGKLGEVIDAAIGAGANRVEGIAFQLDDDAAATQRALARAIENAKAKASAMASALGLALGPVLEVQEAGAFVSPPTYQPRFARVQAMAMVEDSTPVSPGTVTVTANVSVRYRLGE